ncbi:MAG: hypothetical protein JSW28_02690, partial [Thermoplasmata archaeon]
CGAFLWVGKEGAPKGIVKTIEQSIAEVNKKLSHPEQLKRWAILKNDLSIENGDLTASLKLKRWDVMERKAEVVEALYARDSPQIEELIHLGGVGKTG